MQEMDIKAPYRYRRPISCQTQTRNPSAPVPNTP